MSTNNATLGGIDMWLRERGYMSILNLSYRKGSPCFAGTPNITLPSQRVFIRMDDDRLLVGLIKPDCSYTEFDRVMLELSDPEMLDNLVTILENRNESTSRQD